MSENLGAAPIVRFAKQKTPLCRNSSFCATDRANGTLKTASRDGPMSTSPKKGDRKPPKPGVRFSTQA